MRWIKWLVLFVFVAAIGGLFYFNRIQWGGPHGGPMPIYAAPLEARTYTPSLEMTGRLSAAAAAEIRPTFTGVVQAVHFTEGQRVKAGDALFAVDLRAYNAPARQAAAQLRQAQAAYTRGVELRAQDAISVADLEARKAARDAAAAASAEAGVAGDVAVVKAPIAGRVGRAEVTVGALVSREAGTLLTTVQNTEDLFVDFDLPERTVLALMQEGSLKGMPVALGLATDGAETPYTATLTGVDNRLEPQSGSLRVRATVANPQGTLLPGLFARIKLTLPKAQEVLLVNDGAIGTEQTLRFVYKINAQNQPERVAVTVGDMVEGLRAIEAVSGTSLKAGDYVVVNGLMRIRPGMETMPFPADMRTAQPVSGSAPLGAPKAQTL